MTSPELGQHFEYTLQRLAGRLCTEARFGKLPEVQALPHQADDEILGLWGEPSPQN